MKKLLLAALYVGLLALGCFGCGTGNNGSSTGNKVSYIEFCNTIAEAGCDRISSCQLLGDQTLDDCYKYMKGQMNCSEKTGECPKDKLNTCTYDYFNSISCSDFQNNTTPGPSIECKGICSN